MNPQHAHWFVLVLVNIPVFLGLGQLIFRGWEGFLDALRAWSDMDWIANIKKEWRDERWETSKLPVFLLLCLLLVLCEHLMFGASSIKPAAQSLGV